MKVAPILISLFFLFCSLMSIAQDDLMDIINESEGESSEKITTAFKSSRLISAHTTETLGKGDFDFRVDHRFGNVSIGHDALWGFDNVVDMRLAFEYGLTDKLTIAFGRSKANYMDGFVKYKLMHQTTDNKVPVSIALFASTGAQPHGFFPKFFHRFSYFSQAIISRKLNSHLSVEVLPAYLHRNLVDEEDENGMFALGAGLRYMFTRSSGLIIDFYQPFSSLRNSDNYTYFPPLGIGYELETGGHVFHLTFTNAIFLTETRYISNSPDSWADTDFKFGFNISRVF